MLAFITSVRHPQNSSDYSRVEDLLRATLRSVCRQTDGDFVVVVVCNQVPAGDFPDNVVFVPVDFPAPVLTAGPQTGREAVLLDKGTKLAMALVVAQQHHPDYVMKVDADDFVSRRLSAFTKTGGPGWFVDHGFVASSATGLMAPMPAFNTRCGTSEIVANELYALPGDLPSTDATQDEIFTGLGEFLVRDLLGSHRVSVEHFAAQGHPLEPLPFAGAAYLVGTGENHSGKSEVPRGRPVTAGQAEEFGLEHLRRPAAWLSFGRSEAVASVERVRRSRFNPANRGA